ncbi:MAG: hypothetical protein WC565_03260 [Parcubacteria group bacterium]
MTEEELVQQDEPIEPTDEDQSDEDVPCVTCDLSKTLATMSLTTACHLVDDENAREDCIKWADSIDPSKVSDFGEVAKEIVRKAGIPSLNQFAQLTNTVMHDAIIEVVREKLDTNQPVTDEDMRVYKLLVSRRGV